MYTPYFHWFSRCKFTDFHWKKTGWNIKHLFQGVVFFAPRVARVWHCLLKQIRTYQRSTPRMAGPKTGQFYFVTNAFNNANKILHKYSDDCNLVEKCIFLNMAARATQSQAWYFLPKFSPYFVHKKQNKTLIEKSSRQVLDYSLKNNRRKFYSNRKYIINL